MQAENLFLNAVISYLTSQGGLTPVPKLIGVAEPSKAAELPGVIVSLESVARAGGGLGGRTETMVGALFWQASIDLASPYLPDEPDFSLLSADRKVLTLPHGGLVRHDGTTGPLAAADITVKLNSTTLTLVSGTPASGQYKVDPTVGQLTFGSALPATGTVTATYYVGQWEQQVQRIAGALRIDAMATDGADSAGLSQQAIEAMLSSAAKKSITRLLAISLTSVGSVGVKESASANGRRRSARFQFEFEAEINAPESSGGVIQRIPVTTHVSTSMVDAETGAISETVETEESEV